MKLQQFRDMTILCTVVEIRSALVVLEGGKLPSVSLAVSRGDGFIVDQSQRPTEL